MFYQFFKKILTCFTFLPCAAALWYSCSVNASTEIPSNQIIIKWRTTTHAQPEFALQFVRNLSERIQVFRVPMGLEPKYIVQVLSKLPGVQWAGVDRLLQLAQVPNDSRYHEQWNLFEKAGGINLPKAWEITKGSKETVVAVVDSGVLPHPDLKNQLLPGYDFVASALMGNDGDGRDADPTDPGDWMEPFDCHWLQWWGSSSSWHGTHVSGIIAAETNNNLGIAGIAGGVKILPVRTFGKCGGLLSDILDSIRWAAGLEVKDAPTNLYPAKIINLSIGGPGSCEPILQDAITEVIKKGAVVVVAAGNDRADVDGVVPANCTGVITVAANDRKGGLAQYSNFGSKITITAPGGTENSNGILSAFNEGDMGPTTDTYGFYSGTSMAAPHVSGVVALMRSIAPEITGKQVLDILKKTSRPFPKDLKNTCDAMRCGAGLLDAGAAVQAAKQYSPHQHGKPSKS